MTDTAASPLVPSRRATLIGSLAVLMWSTLALFTTGTGTIPPFQLVSMAFLIGGVLGLAVSLIRRKGDLRHFRQPLRVWGLGIGGLFGYHFFYFLALRLAPPVEANLINYLWPLLIVLLSAFLPGQGLRWWHVVGAVSGLIGTGLLVTGGGGIAAASVHLPGYLAALAAALLWAAYSVLSRREAAVPTDVVAGFCVATALLAALCHLLFERTVMPQPAEWLAVLGLGLGPVGAAFFVWDHGLKHGDIRALGVFAYAAPLLSTLLLILFGIADGSPVLWAACALIIGGAMLASRDMIRRRGADTVAASRQGAE